MSRRQLFPGGSPSPGGFPGKSGRDVSCPQVAPVMRHRRLEDSVGRPRLCVQIASGSASKSSVPVVHDRVRRTLRSRSDGDQTVRSSSSAFSRFDDQTAQTAASSSMKSVSCRRLLAPPGHRPALPVLMRRDTPRFASRSTVLSMPSPIWWSGGSPSESRPTPSDISEKIGEKRERFCQEHRFGEKRDEASINSDKIAGISRRARGPWRMGEWGQILNSE